MRVTIIGGGGREQALAWICRRDRHDVELRTELGELTSADTDLVIPGPEAPLVAGIADVCATRSIPCFGPVAAAAVLEGSKSVARRLATDLAIPGPRFATFEGPDAANDALAWWGDAAHDVVVKLDGLAGGKGVAVPASDDDTRAAIRSAAATGRFVLEERLRGPECSLLALCDGNSAVALPLAQDHKRIGEGDTGPNTGGMGAYAPAPVPYSADELLATFVQPVLDHLRDSGTPYVGVLYAGLMLTPDGPRLIEYNVRFGDPEAQAVLPLVASDLAATALACTAGDVSTAPLEMRPASAVTVVAAAAGYPDAPEAGAVITDRGHGADGHHRDDALRFDAGVAASDEGDTVAGGRVLAVTGLGDDLGAARAAAYRRMDQISFDGMQVRRDIAWRAPGAGVRSYAAAGVDIDEGGRAVDQMRAAVESTHDNGVLGGVGSFGGVFSAAAITALDEPVLVASTDGVGTKVELAARLGRVRGVGEDIVNHCIDDVLVQGARPLFFLDYIAASTLDADMVAEVVSGMADACRRAGCALLGGETAEMPGVYQPGAFDIAGTLVGVADRARLLPRADIAPGDALVGLASNGPHTNGYSLLRKIFDWIPMDVVPDGFDAPLADALLAPHRSYLDVLGPLLDGDMAKGLAHITGGGLLENVPRVLPEGCAATIDLRAWPLPPLFALAAELTPEMSIDERYRTLNMGIGMVVVCAPADVADIQAAIDEPTWLIGEVTAGDRTVTLTP
ncbi:MAG: phosphoribosylamine--glycine ligase [Actinomycetota bacterium]